MTANVPPRSAGEELWSFRVPFSGAIVGEPLVAVDAVFFTRGDTLFALDRASGRLRWSHRFVKRRGLARWFSGRQLDDFESLHGTPTLSTDEDRVIVSSQAPGGEALDFAVEIATGLETALPARIDPLSVTATGGLRLTIEGSTTGRTPILCASDRDGRFLWDNRSAAASGFRSDEWLSPIGRPVPGGDRVLFGIRETRIDRGTPGGYRLMALRLADGRLLWDRLNRATDREVLGVGFDGRSFWILVNQRDGVPRLRLHNPENGEPQREARFPGLTGGIAVDDGVLYGGFGRSLVAVTLAI